MVDRESARAVDAVPTCRKATPGERGRRATTTSASGVVDHPIDRMTGMSRIRAGRKRTLLCAA